MQEWGLAHIVENDAEHFVGPQGIKGLRDCISWRTFCPYNHNTDFSVVLFRPTFMLISEKNRMKVHKNQWLLTMPYPPECLSGRTFRTPLEPVDSILVIFRPIYSIKKTFNKFGGLYE
jgi:hypothetical protein